MQPYDRDLCEDYTSTGNMPSHHNSYSGNLNDCGIEDVSDWK